MLAVSARVTEGRGYEVISAYGVACTPLARHRYARGAKGSGYGSVDLLY